MRDRDPESLAPLSVPSPGEGFDFAYGTWTDYDGDSVYGDYTISVGGGALSAVRTADHMPGTYQTTIEPAETNWYHADQVGTTRSMTDESHAVSKRAIYTAFGELVDETGSVGTRYGYCGAFGYEGGSSTWGSSGNDEGFMQVGDRFYDPATGRFLQRDPIGIRGGFNTYEYARSNPIDRNDPAGRSSIPWPPDIRPGPNTSNGTGTDVSGTGPSLDPRQIGEEILDRYIGKKSDKWMHFVVSCRVTSEKLGGFLYLLPCAGLKEIADLAGGADLSDSFGDMLSNAAGWAMGASAAVGACDCEQVANGLGL
jgi:RHS repeat-associated protein